jgi:hypothetical protein
MPDNRVGLLYDGTIGAGATVNDRVLGDGIGLLGLLFVMNNATAAGDIGAVNLKIYDGQKPPTLVSNLNLNSSYTLGPTLVGAVSQKLVVFDVTPFAHCQWYVTNTAGASRNLKVWGYYDIQ